MEQARYWMWTKRKHDLGTDFNDHVLSSSSHVHPSVAAAAAATASFGDSWEEQAFAEDAAGSLGGCVWPPRSYSCSFCRREFKSAQALGGHMNVHRRDRARLKQSPPNPHGGEREGENVLLQNHLHNNILNYNPQICTYLYKRNSDNSSSPPPPLPQPPPPQQPPIRVSALPPPDDDKTAPFLTSIIINPDDDDDDDDREKLVTPEQSWSNFVSDTNKKKKSSSTKSSSESNLSVSLNLLLCRTQIRNASAIDGDEETTCQSSKRRRLIDASSFTLFPKSSEVVLKNIPSSSMEDLDLELRLGDPPKVK